MKAFGIFEGGGAKGLAHIGALRSAQDRGVEFIGVAGASAGAVVAAFVAAGYTAEEMFDPDEEATNALFHEDLVSHLDSRFWNRMKPIKERMKTLGLGLDDDSVHSRVRRILSRLGQVVDPKNIGDSWRIFRIVLQIILRQGVFDADQLEKWIERKLREKLYPEEPLEDQEGVKTKSLSIAPKTEGIIRRPISFEDLPIPLSIVTTDLTSRNLCVFSSSETPAYPVSKAVAASLSLPFIFQPIVFKEKQLIDGGVLSNFPAWVFDDQRRARLGPTPTFGFRLQKTRVAEVGRKASTGIVSFFDSLFATIFSGDNLLEVREIEDLNLIPIDVRASTLDFDMGYDEKRQLYLEGYRASNDFFSSYIGPKDPDDIRKILKFLRRSIKQVLKNDSIHLRANVWLPIPPKREKLRILYTYNMSDDADDRLTLNCDQGCVGLCWQEHRIVWADLAKARSDYAEAYRMSKYQQALVRSQLNSLISVPIFDRNSFNNEKPWIENPLIGALCIDSDENLLDEFSRAADDEGDELRQLLVDASNLLAKEICG